MKKHTEALHIRVPNDGTSPAVTPVYKSSAFTADSPYFYTRKNNPNIEELEQVLACLENARHAVAVGCGMSAIYMCLDLLRPGQKLVLNKDTYGCSYKLFQRICQQRNFELHVLDLSIEENVQKIPKDTAMVFFETPTNPFLKTISIRHVSRVVKANNPHALLVVDNTWATPLFQHPLQHGADISIHSGTKYLAGHSDVMNGVLLTNNSDLHNELLQTRFYGGMLLAPESAWMVRRSLQTLSIRMERHVSTTAEMISFLSEMPPIQRVYFPEIDGEQLTSYGGILFFAWKKELAPKYAEFADRLRLFSTGTGMACVTSMVAQPYTGSHASMSDAEKSDMGLGPELVRLSFGMEDPEDLKNDLKSAFEQL